MERRLSDEELIQSYRETGRKALLDTLYRRYARKVYFHCLALTRDAEKAEDYTHDIFIHIFSTIDQFQRRSTFYTWLYSVCTNYCLGQIRKANRLITIALEEEHANLIPDSFEWEAIDLMLLQMERIFKQMDPDKVALLRLKYEKNIESKEIARRFQMNDSTVKMRLKRARDEARNLYRTRFS